MVRAFSVFVGQTEAPTEIVSEFLKPRFSEFWEPWLSDKLKYTYETLDAMCGIVDFGEDNEKHLDRSLPHALHCRV